MIPLVLRTQEVTLPAIKYVSDVATITYITYTVFVQVTFDCTSAVARTQVPIDILAALNSTVPAYVASTAMALDGCAGKYRRRALLASAAAATGISTSNTYVATMSVLFASSATFSASNFSKIASTAVKAALLADSALLAAKLYPSVVRAREQPETQPRQREPCGYSSEAPDPPLLSPLILAAATAASVQTSLGVFATATFGGSVATDDSVGYRTSLILIIVLTVVFGGLLLVVFALNWHRVRAWVGGAGGLGCYRSQTLVSFFSKPSFANLSPEALKQPTLTLTFGDVCSRAPSGSVHPGDVTVSVAGRSSGHAPRHSEVSAPAAGGGAPPIEGQPADSQATPKPLDLEEASESAPAAAEGPAGGPGRPRDEEAREQDEADEEEGMPASVLKL